MTMKKVAILTHDIGGGAFTSLGTALSRGFQELGIDCEFVVLKATQAEKDQYPDINIVTLNTRRTAFSLLPTIRYLKQSKPDVIFPMPWYFNVTAIWARYLSGIDSKIIIGEHNIISLETGIEHQDKLHLQSLPTLMRYTYPYGDGLIAVSQDTIADLVETIKVPPRIPMRVIFNPIDLDRVQQLAKKPTDHPWFLDSETPTIVTVARLAKQKQLDVLLRAFARVVKIQPARLLILGEGPLRSQLETLCYELQIEDCVAMPGYDRNPYRYMSACDVFVLASAWEGCPIALQEAMACGAAVVVNDAPGGSKDLIEYGKHGMMVAAGDPEALATGILQILSNPSLKQHYQTQARKRARDFQYLKIAQQYLDFSTTGLVRQEVLCR
ncbi:glycosyltransferase [Scytonema millei]|uniref:Glycosyltransferase n=1 Tax=Scytonema millei VB511283 TaxID=1245923 RepID=A0A9X5E6A9_9CYAN|nr:glycosyltransferase [Scytonema millei]NHC35708.1 glycosyltransferase [Scytonema millei VB511283]